jgi:ApaG protein
MGIMFEAETQQVVVRVRPRFLETQSDPDGGRFVWSYTVEIHNRSPEAIQLISRKWRITDDNGFTQEVIGPGVVGEQPVLAPGMGFEYTSGAPLATPAGVMVGWYQMIRVKDRKAFDVAIPAFPLDSPYAKRLPT